MELSFSGRHTSVDTGLPTIPLATPVVRGRLTLPAVSEAPTPARVAVVVGLRSACFVGTNAHRAPGLGSLVHRTAAALDRRRRLVLERRVRGFLGVEDPSCFDVVVVALA